jgi:hypothetical protein
MLLKAVYEPGSAERMMRLTDKPESLPIAVDMSDWLLTIRRAGL